MLSPDLPEVLDRIGINTQRFGTLRHRYYDAVHYLVTKGRKEEAIELIKLAVGITAFDEAQTTPVAERKYHPPDVIYQPKAIRPKKALRQLEIFDYSALTPFCYELLSQDNYPELRKAAGAIFENDSPARNRQLRLLGARICGICVYRAQCNTNLSSQIEL